MNSNFRNRRFVHGLDAEGSKVITFIQCAHGWCGFWEGVVRGGLAQTAPEAGMRRYAPNEGRLSRKTVRRYVRGYGGVVRVVEGRW